MSIYCALIHDKDLGQKWKVRNGAVVFQKIFVKWWLFSTGVLTMAVSRSRGTMPVVRDVLMMVGKGCQGFHKEVWWEWDEVHKTWQMHCWLFWRQIHQWQAQKLARDFQRKRYQGKRLGLEEENCFWWCGFSRWSNQKRHSEGRQSQMLKEEVKNCFCRGWCWSFERAVYRLC